MRTISPKKKTMALTWDARLLLSSVSILLLGLLMVASASMTISARQFGQPLHFIIHQLVFAGVGVGVAWVCLCLPVRVWAVLSPLLFIGSVGLLGIVLVPGLGRTVNGSVRWLQLGPVVLQVSELAKLALVLYLARYLSYFQEAVRQDWRAFLWPLFLLGSLGVLLLLEPDFGTTAVMTTMVLGMMFLAGVRLRQFSVLLGGCAMALAGLLIAAPYRLHRLTSFLDPWAHQFAGGYQLTQSLIAFGRGGIVGVGLGNSVQKLLYLPEAHTDFLFAVLGEELGLIGTLLVISLVMTMVWRIFAIGKQAEVQKLFYSAYTCYGIALWLGVQSLVNIGVNIGVLPTKGIPLPLMSYGGSSMLVNCIAIAIVMRIQHENRHPSLQSPLTMRGRRSQRKPLFGGSKRMMRQPKGRSR